MCNQSGLTAGELAAIAKSRAIRIPPQVESSPVEAPSLKAICLSGGGVRSATFATGVFNSWAKNDGEILRKFDYLSTVSGGGYFGAFYGRFFEQKGQSTTNTTPHHELSSLYKELADDHAQPIKYLKRNGRYLANSKDEGFVAAVVVIRNMIWLHFMLLLGVIPVMAIVLWIYLSMELWGLYSPLLIPASLVAILLLFTVVHFVISPYGNDKVVRRIASISGLILRIFIVTAVLCAVTAVALYLRKIDLNDSWYLAVGAFISALYKWYPKIQDFMGKSSSLKMVTYVVAFLVLLVYLVAISYLVVSLYDWLKYSHTFEFVRLYNEFPTAWDEVFLTLIVVPFAVAVVLNKLTHSINHTSLHYFYAARLRRAFLGAANPKRFPAGSPIYDASEYEKGDDVPLQAYRPFSFGGPLHIINVTLNNSMAPGNNLWWPDCKGQNLAVSSIGYNWSSTHSAQWEDKRPPLSLAQWVAISGAAASTGMGQSSTGATSLLAALFNIRTGLWWHRESRRVFYRSFWAELSNRYRSEEINDWYLSDGGHFENLAVYEMVRRRIPRIVAVDAGGDSEYQFEDLGNLIRRVKLDFQCELQLADATQLATVFPNQSLHRHFGQLDQLHAAQPEPRWHQNPSNVKRAVLLHGHFEQSDQHFPAKDIYILYIKPTLTRQESPDILRYQLEHPDFPHESTADQFFDEAQWESYRKLGEITGNELAEAVKEFLRT